MSRTTMYSCIYYFQIFSVVFLIFGAAYVFFKWKTVQHKYLFIFCFSTVINNLGYLIELTAGQMGPALAGLRISYLGKVLIPLGCFAFVMELVNMKVPRRIYALMTVFHLAAFFLVLTSDYQHLFYTDLKYVNTGLFPHLEVGRGPVWYVYMFVYIGYIIGGLFIMIRYYLKCKKPRRRKQMAMLMIHQLILK